MNNHRVKVSKLFTQIPVDNHITLNYEQTFYQPITYIVKYCNHIFYICLYGLKLLLVKCCIEIKS